MVIQRIEGEQGANGLRYRRLIVAPGDLFKQRLMAVIHQHTYRQARAVLRFARFAEGGGQQAGNRMFRIGQQPFARAFTQRFKLVKSAGDDGGQFAGGKPDRNRQVFLRIA